MTRLSYTHYWQSRDAILTTTTKEAKALVHVLRFIVGIVTQSDSACRTALKAGILDMLLRVYVIFPSFSHSSVDAPEHWSTLLKACRSIFIALSQSQENNDTILRHPVYALWRDCDPHPPAYSLEPQSPRDTLLARCAAWREAVKACIKRRIVMIFIDGLWKSNVFEIENIEACADIVEFAQ